LCFYYVTYLRQLQANLLESRDRMEFDEVYNLITRRSAEEPVEDVLVAIDGLLNSNGASLQSFDDVLRDEETQIQQFIPTREFDFIRQFDEYVDPRRIGSILRRLVPNVRHEETPGQLASSLMPLLLVLRILPSAPLDLVLYKLPIPIVVMLRNRLLNGTQDDVAKSLLERIKEMMEARKSKGESYGVASRANAPVQMQSERRGAAPTLEESLGAKPAARAAGAPTQAAPPRAAAAARSVAPAAPGTAAPSQTAAGRGTSVLDERLLLAWRLEGTRIAVLTLSPRELIGLVGVEPRFLVPWVVVALKTGQAYRLTPDQVNKETMERLVAELMGLAPKDVNPRLSTQERAGLLQQAKGVSQTRFLVTVLKAGRLGESVHGPGSLGRGLEGLASKAGATLGDFLRQPGHDSFRELRTTLTNEEKQAISVLTRVARVQ
jgi:hypothetical protein